MKVEVSPKVRNMKNKSGKMPIEGVRFWWVGGRGEDLGFGELLDKVLVVPGESPGFVSGDYASPD